MFLSFVGDSSSSMPPAGSNPPKCLKPTESRVYTEARLYTRNLSECPSPWAASANPVRTSAASARSSTMRSSFHYAPAQRLFCHISITSEEGTARADPQWIHRSSNEGLAYAAPSQVGCCHGPWGPISRLPDNHRTPLVRTENIKQTTVTIVNFSQQLSLHDVWMYR